MAAAAASGSNVIVIPVLLAIVDVLAFMKRGTPFLKYGKSGYPHFRQFQLSSDNTRIVWYSANKDTSSSQVDLYRVADGLSAACARMHTHMPAAADRYRDRDDDLSFDSLQIKNERDGHGEIEVELRAL